MLWFVLVIVAFVAALITVDKLLAAPRYDEDDSDHFDGKRFINPNDAGNHHYLDVLKWWLSFNDKGAWPDASKEDIPGFTKPEARCKPDKLRLTFVNHSTFLIQTNGYNILTDPIWSDRASPYDWIGPKRMRPPGIKYEDLPPIDYVLISHNHYDHLDIQTVQRLHEDHKPTFIVPLGVEKFLADYDIPDTISLDWWGGSDLQNGLHVQAVPARHFSGRGLFDRNKTLWCGYVLSTEAGNIYFAGDTGYGNFIKEIGERFSPIQLSIIPIGAYKPRWFMEPIHLSPEEAILAHRDLNSCNSIAMHFGTFPLADDGMYDATEALKKELSMNGVYGKQFHILAEGQTEVYSGKNFRKGSVG